MTNEWLKDQGLLSVKDLWVNIYLPLADSLPDYGPLDSVNRLVRTRGVGAGGLRPPATRLYR